MPVRDTRPPEFRFWTFVDKSDDCWVWTGAKSIGGYGVFHFSRSEKRKRRIIYAHRFAYELEHGPIADGLQIDHLCRTRACVRASHLEAVTSRENTMRGENFTAREARVTHCPQGHEYTPENTYTDPKNMRHCRTCKNAQWRAMYRRQRSGLPMGDKTLLTSSQSSG